MTDPSHCCCRGQFNREKIPERVVHARGMGAKGFFEVGAYLGFHPLTLLSRYQRKCQLI